MKKKPLLTPAEIIDRYTARYTDFERATGQKLTVQSAACHLKALLITHDMRFDTVLSRRLEEIMPMKAM